MSICDSEENRRKLAWLVPAYILLAWFFCVLFQPLSLRSGPYRRYGAASSTSSRNRPPLLPVDESVYKVIYMDEMSPTHPQAIQLSALEGSALVVRLSRKDFRVRPFNASVKIEAGPGLDGVVGVIENLNLRRHEDDSRGPGGHWGSSLCLDRLRIRAHPGGGPSDGLALCGQREPPEPGQRLVAHGSSKSIVGYCDDAVSGRSCEGTSIELDISIDRPEGKRFGAKASIDTVDFSVVVTGYRHRDDSQNATSDEGDCGLNEFSCPSLDNSVHWAEPHCIWDRLVCDDRPNCGFAVNADETDCSGSGGPHSSTSNARVRAWSASMLSLMVGAYMAVVVVLVLVTMVLLRWHRNLRTPLDVIEESRSGSATRETRRDTNSGGSNFPSTRLVPVGDLETFRAAMSSEGRTVSVIVSYRPALHPPPSAAARPKTEAPPSYDSLFRREAELNAGAAGVSGSSEEPPPPAYNEAQVAIQVQQEEPMGDRVHVLTAVHQSAGGGGAGEQQTRHTTLTQDGSEERRDIEN